MRHSWVLAVVVVALAACGPSQPVRRPAKQDPSLSTVAVAAARAGQFDTAQREADRVLAAAPRDSAASAVRALARYQRAGEVFVHEIGAVIERGETVKALDHQQGRNAWATLLGELEAVDRDLAIAAGDPGFALELCLACWEHDWNHTGEVDARDRKLFELEYDGSGGELAEGDPRRRPTYRFDVGDVLWARAMVSFQRGLVELVLAYRWSELDKLFAGRGDDQPITIKLVDAGRVRRAHNLFVSALAFSGQEREAYLSETDDDREWLPNPRQKSYAMPLPVDAQLYDTWDKVLGDVQRWLAGQEGVSLRAAGALFDEDDARMLPDVYVDLGRMLREPTDIVFDFRSGGDKTAVIERALRGLLGNGYVRTMRASPLVGRLRHMKEQLMRGEDSLEKKLRYLFWVN